MIDENIPQRTLCAPITGNNIPICYSESVALPQTIPPPLNTTHELCTASHKTGFKKLHLFSHVVRSSAHGRNVALSLLQAASQCLS